MFKLAAKQAIESNKNSTKAHIENMSVKYQVLSKHTNMVGIKKNRIKASVVSEAPISRTKINTRSNQVMSQQENFNKRQNQRANYGLKSSKQGASINSGSLGMAQTSYGAMAQQSYGAMAQ